MSENYEDGPSQASPFLGSTARSPEPELRDDWVADHEFPFLDADTDAFNHNNLYHFGGSLDQTTNCDVLTQDMRKCSQLPVFRLFLICSQ